MAYSFSYTTDRPLAREDGSGDTSWVIIPFYRVDEGDWLPILGTDKLFFVRASELAVVNAMPHATGAQKAAKGQALIALILGSVDNTNVPVVGYTADILEQIVDANELAAAQVAAIHDFITVTMGQTYPVRFTA